jgi:hypothetical protein
MIRSYKRAFLLMNLGLLERKKGIIKVVHCFINRKPLEDFKHIQKLRSCESCKMSDSEHSFSRTSQIPLGGLSVVLVEYNFTVSLLSL